MVLSNSGARAKVNVTRAREVRRLAQVVIPTERGNDTREVAGVILD